MGQNPKARSAKKGIWTLNLLPNQHIEPTQFKFQLLDSEFGGFMLDLGPWTAQVTNNKTEKKVVFLIN